MDIKNDTNSLSIFSLQNDSYIVKSLKNEVVEFGCTSGLASGVFASLDEAQQFTTEIMASRFAEKSNQQHCFSIKLDGQIVGRAWLMERQVDAFEKVSDPDIRLAYIKVDEKYQRHGIATATIKLLEAYSIKLGYKKMSLNVFSNLPYAKKLYLALGFTVDHETVKNGKTVTTEMCKLLNK